MLAAGWTSGHLCSAPGLCTCSEQTAGGGGRSPATGGVVPSPVASTALPRPCWELGRPVGAVALPSAEQTPGGSPSLPGRARRSASCCRLGEALWTASPPSAHGDPPPGPLSPGRTPHHTLTNTHTHILCTHGTCRDTHHTHTEHTQIYTHTAHRTPHTQTHTPHHTPHSYRVHTHHAVHTYRVCTHHTETHTRTPHAQLDPKRGPCPLCPM